MVAALLAAVVGLVLLVRPQATPRKGTPADIQPLKNPPWVDTPPVEKRHEPPSPEQTAGVGSGLKPGAPRLALSDQQLQLRRRVVKTVDSPWPQVRAQSNSERTAPAVTDPAGSVVDRTGELGAEALRMLNEELMPLVDECFDQARERNPGLSGLLAFNAGTATAEDFGGIVETVEADSCWSASANPPLR